MHKIIYLYILLHINLYIYRYLNIYKYIFLYIHTHIYIFILIYIYLYIYIRIFGVIHLLYAGISTRPIQLHSVAHFSLAHLSPQLRVKALDLRRALRAPVLDRI